MEHSQCLQGPVEVPMVMPFSRGGDRQEGRVLLCPHSSTAVRVCACGGGLQEARRGLIYGHQINSPLPAGKEC